MNLDRSWVAAALAAGLVGCGARPPKGVLGVRWGEPMTEVAADLGVRCVLDHGQPYQRCRAESVRALDRNASVELVARSGHLVGASIHFDDGCGTPRLQQDIAEQFGVEYTAGSTASPYTSWSSGEVVHFRDCVLTVGNADYGEYFVGRLISSGFGDLGNTMTPH